MTVVIGGANADILGHSTDALIPGDSNPGKIRIIPGGVGRNIADTLAEYAPEEKVELITLLSDDSRSLMIREQTEKAGVSLEHSFIIPGEDCPTYLAVMDRGEMISAVNDMTLMDKLTPPLLEPLSLFIEKAEMIILDANIPGATIKWLTKNFPKALFIAEPVSAAKCSRFQPVLNRIFLIKPNRMEAERLTGQGIHNVSGALKAVKRLLKQGTENVIITLGAGGAVYGSRNGCGHIPPLPLKETINSTNGAGDAFLAGALQALKKGNTLEEATRLGSRLAEKVILNN